ncbi:hypothetical protein TNCV_3762461 [Trichonephila clavipes]|nr:hypothetical protein TNCV_3762461 [Trichonephila clavipes]
MKAEKECSLTPLESRRKLSTIKFTSNIRSLPDDHISSRTFKAWSDKSRLKRDPQPCNKNRRSSLMKLLRLLKLSSTASESHKLLLFVVSIRTS